MRATPPRYDWKPLPKPWYWWLTFWKSKWRHYGHYEEIKPHDPRFEAAPYQMDIIMSPNVYKTLVKLPKDR